MKELSVKFIPNDLWIGIFWKTPVPAGYEHFGDGSTFDESVIYEVRKVWVHVCIIPMICFIFPIKIRKQIEATQVYVMQSESHPNCRCSLHDISGEDHY